MTPTNPTPEYAFGSSDAEHERLIWQAQRLAPFSERFLREVGILSGQRVLDLGSGLGDLTFLVRRIVGPSGEVIGVERDPRSIAKARSRVAEAGLHNVSFIESDVSNIPDDKPFDAVVGRFILQFVPDPAEALRTVSKNLRPGGAIAFQEVSWAHFLLACADLPLWSATAHLARDTLAKSGANPEIGFALYRIFQEGGLPAPMMSLEMPLGSDPASIRWLYDLLRSLRPQIQKLGLSLERLGDFDTLTQRLQAEVTGSKRVVPAVAAVVEAWCHKPSSNRP